MSDFNAAQVLAEAYTLYKKHHDGMGLDFKIAIAQIQREAAAQALREAREAWFEHAEHMNGTPSKYYPSLWLKNRADLLEGDDVEDRI